MNIKKERLENESLFFYIESKKYLKCVQFQLPFYHATDQLF